MDRYRNWCFTLNNYTEEEYNQLKHFGTYVILGKEQGKLETPHLQGYFEFDRPIRFTRLRKFNNRIHWERRRGTQIEAINYCKKDNNYQEFGSPKHQGERTDLKAMYIHLKQHKSIKKLIEDLDTWPSFFSSIYQQ
jgi:hypothetical protein